MFRTLNIEQKRGHIYFSNLIVRYWPFSARRDRQKTADSVEKVGHGFHDRKVHA